MSASTAIITILLVTVPEWGHLNPSIHLAHNIQRHWDSSKGTLDLTLASMEQARAAVEKEGIKFLSIGKWSKEEEREIAQIKKLLFDASAPLTKKMKAGAGAVMLKWGMVMGTALMDHLERANSSRNSSIRMPDVIVSDGITTAGLDAAEHFKIPLAVAWNHPINMALMMAGYPQYNDAAHVPLEFMNLITPEDAHPVIRHWINPVLKKAVFWLQHFMISPARHKVRETLGLTPVSAPVIRKTCGARSNVTTSYRAPFAVGAHVPRAIYLAGITWELNVERELPPAWHVVGPQGVDYGHNFPPQFGPEDQAVADFLQEAAAAGEPVVFAAAGTTTILTEEQVAALLEAFLTISTGSSSNSNDNNSSSSSMPRARVLWALKPEAQQLLPNHWNSCSNPELIHAEPSETCSIGSSSGGNASSSGGNIFSSSGRIMIAPWVKQTAVLAHNQTKVFITHGGLGSVHETLALGKAVPLVVPFTGGADHVISGQHLTNRGLGVMLKTTELLKPGSLADAITRLLTDRTYAERVAAVAEKWKSVGYGPGKAAKLVIDFATRPVQASW